MIISASRRTDIPAFYGRWFINRLKSGYVCVRNPFNRNSVSRIPLNPGIIDCIVFWTKDPASFMKYLDFLDEEGYRYYFLFTLNPYDRTIERNVPEKSEIINTFKKLSDRIGKSRVVWRYDPVILTELIDAEYHLRKFSYIAERLENYTERCIFSFLDQYKKVQKNMSHLNIIPPDTETRNRIVSSFSLITRERNIDLFSCASSDNFERYGVRKGSCIDSKLVEKIAGYKIKSDKDSSQRKECLCIESRDIGAYNTCIHDCIYCYANMNKIEAFSNYRKYDPDSEMLCDFLTGSEKITECGNLKSLKVGEAEDEPGMQKKLFDF